MLKQSALSIQTSTNPFYNSLQMAKGFILIDDWLSTKDFVNLRKEAFRKIKVAKKSIHKGDPVLIERGGTPRRKFHSSLGGRTQMNIYNSYQYCSTLCTLTGLELVQSGNQGSYTYYVNKGDCLGLHRDIMVCDLALITLLYEDIPQDGEGGLLCLYPSNSEETLESIKANPKKGRVPIRLKPKQSIALLGGIVPHEVLPLTKNQKRVISVLCYKVNV